MSVSHAENASSGYSVDERAPHSLHECRGAAEFRLHFEATTGCPVHTLADDVVSPSAPKALFLVGSLPLGMATSGSDIDLIVLIDDRKDLLRGDHSIANSEQQMVFSNDSDPLMAGMHLMLRAGILIDLQVAITPAIHEVQRRLRRRGPELSENEVRTLGRLGTGWLLWESEGYLERNAVLLDDAALRVYCCTRNFVSALIHRRKALKAVDLDDFVLATHLGRSSVELAYLAYFASEGLPYLGAKWPAQIGHARGASKRLAEHPVLKEGIRLLFPACEPRRSVALGYLEAVAEFLTRIQALIERQVLFRIAFQACPQIESK
jgi:Nucleotidyltransferase domain